MEETGACPLASKGNTHLGVIVLGVTMIIGLWWVQVHAAQHDGLHVTSDGCLNEEHNGRCDG